MRALRYLVLLAIPGLAAHAQYLKTHDASVSVGAFGQFGTVFADNPTNVSTTAPFSPSGTYNVTVTGQHHTSTDSAGVIATMQFHPVSWAGVELNYSFTHYGEDFAFNYANTSTPNTLQQVHIPTDAHEASAAYIFHARKIPLQPFMGLGGGSIDFDPRNVSADSQWRGAGLAELGFDLPFHWSRIGLRAEGRALFYRAPNFDNSAISTRAWRASAEPVISAIYRF